MSTHKAGQFAAEADRQHNQHLRTIWREADRERADRLDQEAQRWDERGIRRVSERLARAAAALREVAR